MTRFQIPAVVSSLRQSYFSPDTAMQTKAMTTLFTVYESGIMQLPHDGPCEVSFFDCTRTHSQRMFILR